MSGDGLSVLLATPETATRENLLAELPARGFPVSRVAAHLDQARAELLAAGAYYHVILLDDGLASRDHPAALAEFIGLIKQHCPATEVILLSQPDRRQVIPSLQAGASLYLLKPVDVAEVAALLQQLNQHRQLRREAQDQQLLAELLATSFRLGSGQSEQSTLEHILSSIRHIGFDRVRLYLLTDDRKQLLGKAQAGMQGDDFVGVSWPITDDEYLQELLADPRPRVFTCEPGKPTHPEDRLDKEGLREWLCVPLVQNNEVIGLIAADNKYCLRPISEREMAPLAIFANQAAAAIETARLAAQKEEKLTRLAEVARATTEIFGKLGRMPQAEMLHLIARRGAEILAAETCSILLANRPGFLTLAATYGHRPEGFAPGHEFAIRTGPGAGLTGHIAHEGRVFNAHGAQLTRHFAASDAAACHTPSGQCHSLLAIPLAQQGEPGHPIGWLRVDNKKSPAGVATSALRFTAEDEFILHIFAEAIGASIECARWIDELHREKKEKELIIKSMPLAVISIDQYGTVLTFNPQAEEIFGLSQAEVVGAKVYQLYQDEREPHRIGELLDQNNGQISDYETRVKTRSGQIIPIRLAASWLYEKDELEGSVGFFEDLRYSLRATQQRLELALRASNLLAQARDLAEGLQSLAAMMVALLPDTFCRILLYDEREVALTALAAYPLAQSDWEWQPGLGQRVYVADYPGLDLALQKDQPQIIRHSQDNQRVNLEKLSRRLALAQPVQSLLLIPLRREGKLIGLLDLGELRGEEQSQFTPENIALVAAIAAQITVLIEHRRLLETSERRKALLSELATILERLRAEREMARLHEELAAGLAQLTGCAASGLLLHRPRLQQLEVQAAFGLDGLSVGQRVPTDGGLLSRVTQTGKPEIVTSAPPASASDELLAAQNFQTVIAIPLKKSSGAVEAVLFAGDRTGACRFTAGDLEILERFATHASLALQTASLLKSEQRRRDHLLLLDQIHQFIQEAEDKEKVLDAVLTAVTAAYGLQFNRALVLLLDDARQQLLGAAGIGQLQKDEAWAAWAEQKYHELPDFAAYLEDLKAHGVTLTTVGRLARELRFSLENGAAGTQLFAAVLQNRVCRRVRPEQFEQLPAALREQFQPTSELVIVPLATKNQVIGVLIADNKFNRAPIEANDLTLLMSFADTAAVAIDNLRLLNSFYTFANHLKSYQSLDELLEAIGKEVWQATGANAVGLILIDEQGQVSPPLVYPHDHFGDAPPMPRMDGVSMGVLRTGQARTFPNADKEREQLHPGFPPATKAAACLPLSLPDKRTGVMWVHYEQPHHFTDFEVGVLRFFANYVANAYEAAQRIERLEKRRAAYESLALCNSVGEVTQQIVERSRDILRAHCAVFWRYDDKGGAFLAERSLAAGLSAESWRRHQQHVPREDGTAQRVLQQLYLLLRDVADQEQWQQVGEHTRQFITEVGGRGLLGLPLKVGKEHLGVLYLIYQQPITYGKEWLEIALTFANYAALSLKNTQLLEQVTRTNEAARTVATVTTLGDIEKTLDEIVREVKKATQCDAVVLFQHDQHSGALVPHPLMPGVWHPERVLTQAETKDHWLVKNILACDEPTIETDVPAHSDYGQTRFAREEASKSFLGMPLTAIDEKVGALFVTYRRAHRFTADDLEIIELLADQAAVALRIARFIAERERRQENLRQLLHEASRAITASFGPDIEPVLEQLLEQAIKSLSAIKPADHRLIGTIQLYDAVTNQVTVKKIYPPETRQLMLEKIGATWEIDKTKTKPGRIGITGRAILEKRAQLVHDVRQDPDYQEYNAATRAELSVPLFNKGGIPIGVINIESEQLGDFDKEDQQMLERLAEITVVVLENEERYRELLKMQQAVEASTVLAFMSTASAIWWHAIRNHALTIKDTVQLLRDEIRTEHLQTALEAWLQRIEEVSNELLDKHKLTRPLGDKQGAQPQALFPLLYERIRRLCERQNPSVEFLVAPDADRQAIVKVDAQWLNHAIDILAHNAFDAMKSVERKNLTLAIKRLSNNVIVEISDQGTGIPAAIQVRLFRERIEKSPTDKGLGTGLLMARLIIQAHGGDIELAATGKTGTTIRFWLPNA